MRVRMSPRPSDEPHRASSPLELLFDLTFVVAVASITTELAHGIAQGPVPLSAFLQGFFAIWWAWMNFTWFASSYDTDDVPYRLLTLVQMGGVLVLAAGVPAAFTENDYRALTLGYLIMRVGVVAQWLRVALEDPASRGVGLRYASGIATVQVGWVLRLLLDEAGLIPAAWLTPAFAALALLELSVPPWAERKLSTSWHPHHIAERYGLFAIILLGESVLAASTGVGASLRAGGLSGSLVLVATSGLVLLFTLWWLYFLEPAGEGLENHRELAFLWGYGHFGIFATLAALGAGLEIAVERTGGSLEVPAVVVGYAVAIPVAVFLVLLWAVHAPLVQRLVIRPAATIGTSVVVLLLPLASGAVGLPVVVAGIAVACALVVVVTIVPRGSRGNPKQADAPVVLP